MSFPCSICHKAMRSPGGLKKHVHSMHLKSSTLTGMAEAAKEHTFICHPHLSAHPCSSDGTFLPDPVPQPPASDLFEYPDRPWFPFSNRLEYEWAYYHYVRLQSSAEDIQQGLDLWRATVLRYRADLDNVPWQNAKDMYETIDSIKVSGVDWMTHRLTYSGPWPSGTVPHWMQESYELNLRNLFSVFEGQLALKEFDGQFEYTPYEEYDKDGSRVYSNLMSGNWAFREVDTISQDKKMHGAVFIPIIAGSDKMTVSIVTGSQEYHPVYASLGNITNTARHGHGNSMVPVAFLPIPKTSKCQRKQPEYQIFVRQLFHTCLGLIFTPLKPYMMMPRVMKCPDGHFRRIIFGVGPYIVDYPEQVWLGAIVSNWCPKCDALPGALEGPGSHRCSHEKMDLLIKTYDSRVLWDDFGVWHNIVPFTCFFPHADIHELLAPDLLHQIIKGVFKDHLVEWVLVYLKLMHGAKRSLEMIEDIDHRVAAVPPFPGLRRFGDGRDFKQWTGDNLKALMKVFLTAAAGYIPSAMVRCIASFMDACYIARWNAIDLPSLKCFQDHVQTFHQLRDVFIEAGVRVEISFPHQHALSHFYHAIHQFSSPNGLCSSITESKHILATKDTWRRSSKNNPMGQMVRTIQRMDKMLVLRRCFEEGGMLDGFAFSPKFGNTTNDMSHMPMDDSEEHENEDEAIVSGGAEDVKCGYPSRLHALAAHIKQPEFPLVFAKFLYKSAHPDEHLAPSMLEECPVFEGAFKVHHSAVTTFYAPSDLSGLGGLRREQIRSTPCFFGHPRCDTIFVVTDDSHPGMEGMEIGHDYQCALINWFVHDHEHDPDTGMWIVKPEHDCHGKLTLEVIDIDSIAWADFSYHHALDTYQSFFVNHYVDHHAHEFIGRQ
ncbi:hypothetical protein EI94DRAFT_1773267 [Lactarius quietus]|nr:hypothetical protein EI94DRAFT_1773267 [Lactarius quietus]